MSDGDSMRSRANLFLVSCLMAIGCATPTWSQTVTVEVPPWQGIRIVGETEEPTPSGLSIQLELGPDGTYRRPRNVEEMVEVLYDNLPPEFIEDLSYELGFVPAGRGLRRVNTLSKQVALSAFLYKIWGLGDLNTNLGRQINCMSPGEGSISPLYYAVVAKKYFKNRYYEERPDLPSGFDSLEPLRHAMLLVRACSKV